MWSVFLSGIASIYFIFMIYFDWMHPNNMASLRQLSWVLIHAPFHFAQLLLMEAMNQFVIWWKLLEIMRGVSSSIYAILDESSWSSSTIPPTGQQVALELNETVLAFLEQYPASTDENLILDSVTETLNDVLEMPQELWDTIFQADYDGGGTNGTDLLVLRFQADLDALFTSVMN